VFELQRGAARLAHHHGHHPLPEFDARQTENAGVLNFGQDTQRTLHFLRIHVLTARDNDRVGAAEYI